MTEKRNLILPLSFYGILSIVTIIIWWTFEKNTLEDYKSMSNVLSEQISFRIKDDFSYHVTSLHQMKSEWQKTTNRNETEYTQMVYNALGYYGGFQAINFVDTSGTIIWVIPYETNVGALGKSLFAHPDPLVPATFEKARKTGTFQMTPPIPLFQGGMGYASYLPVVIDGKIEGYINGVFRVRDIIEYCISSDEINKFAFYIDDNESEIYRSTNANVDFAMEILGSYTFLAFDRFWSVYVTLDPEFFKSFPSIFSKIVLLSGLFGAFILSLLLRMVLIRREQIINAEKAYRHLVEEMTIGVIILKENNIVFANSKVEQITGFSAEELKENPLMTHIHHSDQIKLQRLYEEISNNLIGARDIEVRFINKEKAELWLWVNCLEFEWENTASIIHLIEDITVRKQKFNALENKENQTRLLFENIPDGVIVSDQENILYANDAFRLLVGAKTTKDIINQPIRKFLHPDYLANMAEGQANLIRKGGKIPFVEEKLIDFSGKIIPIEVSIGIVEFMGENTFQVFVRNISERKKMIEDIQNNERRYRTLFNSSINSMFMLKGDKFIDCNAMTLEVFNCTREQIINSTPFDFSPPYQPSGIDSKTAAMSKIKDALSGIQTSFEWKHSRQDGSLFDADVNLKRIDISGEPHLIATVRDITKIKRSEDVGKVLLKISQAVSTTKSIEELFKNIHRQLGTLMDTSNFYIALYESLKNELSFPYYIDEVDSPPEPQKLKRGLSEYVIHTKTPLFVYEDGIHDLNRMGKIELLGTPSKVWMGTPLISDDDKVIGVIVLQSYSDSNMYSKADMDMLVYMSEQIAISVNKIAREDKLRASEQKYKRVSGLLAESNAMKELLLDVVSHDLKNPAGVLSGISEIMLSEDPDNEFANIINDSSKNLLAVIDNATTLSQMALGEKVETIEIDLVEIIKNVANDFDHQLKETGMKLELALHDNLFIQNNPIISEVFKNYISNALKYALQGEKIIIESILDKTSITINVKDFGATIPEKEYLSVFKRGIQLGSGIKKGRGLGLSIVKRIGEAHGGKVGLRPNTPHGNIFYLQLPRENSK
ncbi:MAG: PAS domain S-box protein [Candidatus Marinimicrobia bacterium]|nr:PAS domain S-box protein [Candidatus Neomarinimicrobiota bacterium]